MSKSNKNCKECVAEMHSWGLSNKEIAENCQKCPKGVEQRRSEDKSLRKWFNAFYDD